MVPPIHDVGAALRELTLPQRVAQLFVFGFPGAEPPPAWLALLEQHRFGGVWLPPPAAGGSLPAPQASAGLLARLQALCQAPPASPAGRQGRLRRLLTRLRGEPAPAATPAPGDGFAPPLLVVGHGHTPLPSPMALAASREEQAAFTMGQIAGQECHALGIHLYAGPVLDVPGPQAAAGAGCFSDSPEVTARWGLAFRRGLHSAGAGSCLRHFPGLGGASQEPGARPLEVREPLLALEARHLAPFRLALEKGGADAIMPSPAACPSLDKSAAPALFSAAIVNRLLREELRFGGAVISPPLDVPAIRDGYTPEAVVVGAVHAGCDLLLATSDLEYQQELLRAALAAARSGRLDPLRLNMAVFRALQLKQARRAGVSPDPDQAAAGAGTPAQQAEALRVARQAITLLRGAGDRFQVQAYAVVAEVPLPGAFAAAMGAPPAPAPPESPAPPGVTVILAARGAELAPAARHLLARGQRAILLLRGEPGALAAYPPDLPALCCYDDSPAMLQAAAEALRGRLRCTGRAPIRRP